MTVSMPGMRHVSSAAGQLGGKPAHRAPRRHLLQSLQGGRQRLLVPAPDRSTRNAHQAVSRFPLALLATLLSERHILLGRNAQLTRVQRRLATSEGRFRHPYYWAPFVLHGAVGGDPGGSGKTATAGVKGT